MNCSSRTWNGINALIWPLLKVCVQFAVLKRATCRYFCGWSSQIAKNLIVKFATLQRKLILLHQLHYFLSKTTMCSALKYTPWICESILFLLKAAYFVQVCFSISPSTFPLHLNGDVLSRYQSSIQAGQLAFMLASFRLSNTSCKMMWSISSLRSTCEP